MMCWVREVERRMTIIQLSKLEEEGVECGPGKGQQKIIWKKKGQQKCSETELQRTPYVWN
jgi:hypothetical protein